MKNHHSQKAYKKCIICGSNFVTSETDSEVFCKDCQSHRDTAKTLQNLLEHINPNEKFSIGDLIPYYKFSALNNIINALMDDGLLDFNPNDNTYSLKDKRVLDDFLNKYLIDPETVELPPEEETYPFNYTKERHEIVIEAIKEGKTRKEAAKLAGINFNYLERWYIEGQKGIEPFKQYYEDYESNKKDPKKKSEEEIKKETEEFNLNKLKINKFIESIKYEFTVKKSAEISGLDYKQVQKWLYYGNRGEKPFNEFSKEYKDAKKEATKNRNIFKKSEAQRDSFIECIKNGNTMLEACKKAELRPEDVSKWIRKGKDDIKPYVKFYERYQKVKGSKKKQTPLEKDLEKYTKEKHETIINAIKEGKSITEAVKLAGISIREESRWYTYGQKGIEPFKQYYVDYNFWKKEGKKKEEIEKEKSEFLKNYKKINIFIKAIMGGKSFREAVQVAELNEKQLQKWLNYGKQGIEPFKITFEEYEEVINKENEYKKYPHKYTKKRHEIVINAIKEGKTRSEAAKLAGIQLRDIEKWYHYGKEGIEPFKQYYYDYESNKIDPQKRKAERIKKETKELEQNSDKIKTFLIETKNGISRNKAAKLAELDYNQIERWLNYGKEGIEPFKQFYENYNKYKVTTQMRKAERIKKETKELEQNSDEIKTFLIETKNGKSRKEAAIRAELDKQQVENWLKYGKEGIEPFKQFLKEYKNVKNENKEVIRIQSMIEKSNYDEKRHKKVIDAIKEGKSREKAAELAGIQFRDIERWHSYGKEGIEPFKQYYYDYESNKIDPQKRKEERIKKETKELEQNSDKIKTFLIEINKGKSRKEAAERAKLDKQQVEIWLRYGKEGIEPFNQFNNDYISNKPDPKKLKEEKIKKETDEFKQKIHKVGKLIETIENGKTIKEAVNLCEFEQNQITLWLNYGKKEIEPFKQFLDEYNQAKIERAKKEKEKEEEEIQKGKEIFKQKSYEIQRFLTAIELGNTREKALELSRLNEEEVARWLRYGRQGIDPFNQFLNEYSNSKRINKIDEKKKLNEKREFEKSLRKFIVKTYDKDLEPEILFNSELIKELKSWEKKGEIVNYGRFTKKYEELEKHVEKNLAEYEENEEKIEIFLNEFRNHGNEVEALENSELDKKLVIKWQNKGKKNLKPYKKFYESLNYIKLNREYDLEEYEANLNKQEIFLKEILDEVPVEKALKASGLEENLMEKWIRLGNAGIEPFRQFLIEYNKSIRRANAKKNKFKRKRNERAIFIKCIEDKDSLSQACRYAKLENEDVEDWLIKGKNGQKPYVEFHKEYENARMASTKKPVPKRYVKSRKKSIKNNKAKLKINVIKETNNLLDVSIEGNIPTSSMDLVNNIMKTYNAQINTSVINRLKNNQLKIYIELTIQKEELGFIKSLIKSY